MKDGPRKTNKSTILAPYLLLVEGPDDFQYFRFLRQRDDLQIHVYEGKDQLELEIKTLRQVEGFDKLRRVVITRDADADPIAARQSALSQWANALSEPNPNVAAETWFPDSSGIEWSVWIVPDSASPGDLEELLWRAVPASEHRTCVESLITCLEQGGSPPFSAKTKAQLYAWLGTQPDPIKQVYAALDKRNGLFDPSDPVFAHHCALLDAV